MSIRPDIRLPWWVLLGFAALVYVGRSALRGWDFAPDPIDAVVFGGLVVLVVARVLLARFMSGGEGPDE